MSRNKLVLSHVGYALKKKITVIHVHLQQVLRDRLLFYNILSCYIVFHVALSTELCQKAVHYG